MRGRGVVSDLTLFVIASCAKSVRHECSVFTVAERRGTMKDAQLMVSQHEYGRLGDIRRSGQSI